MPKQVLRDFLEYGSIPPSSEAAIHYDIARIVKVQGKNEEADGHIKWAQKIAARLMKTTRRNNVLSVCLSFSDRTILE